MESQHGNSTTAIPSSIAALRSTSLTPIRVRGKKRKHADPAFTPPLGARRLRNGVPGSSLEKHKERVLIGTAKFKSRQSLSRSATPASVASSSSFSQLLHQHTKHPQQALSPLEALPAELLQLVFIDNCNPALPLCSPFIAAKLSHPNVYKQFISRTFCHVSCASSGDVWRVAGGVEGTEEELIEVRKRALQMRWINWGLFGEVTTALLQREKSRLASEVFSNGSDEKDKVFHTHGLRLWLGKGVRIPGKLLTWPCQGDQFRFLRALVNMGATVDEGSIDYEVLRETWLHAIKDKDYRLVHILMGPGMFAKPSVDDLRRAVPAVDGDLAMGAVIYMMGELDLAFSRCRKTCEQDVGVLIGELYATARNELRCEQLQRLREARKRRRRRSQSRDAWPTRENPDGDIDDEGSGGDDDEELFDEEDTWTLKDMREKWRERHPDDNEWQNTLMEIYLP